jgi:16S rRNA (guanine966-N2)-methyltransferase
MSGLRFLDLFCGTGAVGVEALSRGAEYVAAVESDPVTSSVASENFSLVSASERRAKIFTMRVDLFLEISQQQSQPPFDVIFMDPPYESSNSEIEIILQRIVQHQFLQLRGVIAVERKSKSKPFLWPETTEELKVRSYGQGSIFYGNYSASVLQ